MTVDNGWWCPKVARINVNIREQEHNEPLREWHRDGKINIQSGMEIDDEKLQTLR
jgi:hypothetical protein